MMALLWGLSWKLVFCCPKEPPKLMPSTASPYFMGILPSTCSGLV